MKNRVKVIKTMIMCIAVIMLPYVIGACKNTKQPIYTLDPTEPTVTETTMVTETTVETTAPTETSEATETTVEETTAETTVPTETTKPIATVTPTTKPTETTKATAKATTKKKSTKKSTKKSSKKSNEDWDGYDDDDAKPTKKPTKKPNTPTPKPYTYCTCDAVVNCGSKAAGNWNQFTLTGLTAHKTSAGVWKLTDASLDKVENHLNKNYPGYGHYGIKKLTNKRNYRYKA